VFSCTTVVGRQVCDSQETERHGISFPALEGLFSPCNPFFWDSSCAILLIKKNENPTLVMKFKVLLIPGMESSQDYEKFGDMISFYLYS